MTLHGPGADVCVTVSLPNQQQMNTSGFYLERGDRKNYGGNQSLYWGRQLGLSLSEDTCKRAGIKVKSQAKASRELALHTADPGSIPVILHGSPESPGRTPECTARSIS